MGEVLWQASVVPFMEKMLPLGRNMFEGNKRGATFRGFEAMNIDVSSFCDEANKYMLEKYA
jgi:hypothetical protein